jgi:protein phosphatase
LRPADAHDTFGEVAAPSSVRSYARTDAGRKRQRNEDCFACDDQLGLFVVADGVGGNVQGHVASSEATDQILGFVRQGRQSLAALAASPGDESRQEVRRLLESAVQSACYMVHGMGELDPTQKGMSTTISALLLVGPECVIAQVGDSRVYRVRDGQAAQLTEDHTLINYKLKRGQITAEEARTAPGKNVITRAVGHKDYVQVDTLTLDVQAGDRYLLCSDGLHGYLNEGEVEAVLAGGPLAEAPERFVDLANARGGKDNITIVLVVVE